jgi:hypothetical protein
MKNQTAPTMLFFFLILITDIKGALSQMTHFKNKDGNTNLQNS